MYGLDSPGYVWSLVLGSCEHGNEPLIPYKQGISLRPEDSHPLGNDFAPKS